MLPVGVRRGLASWSIRALTRPGEVVAHAAGLLADAPVARKDAARFAEVFEIKVAGFLALAHTLKKGEHIRVTLLIGRLQGSSGCFGFIISWDRCRWAQIIRR